MEIGLRSGREETEETRKNKMPRPISQNRIELWAEYKNQVLLLRKNFLIR
jgi:hypothetical protein